MKHTLTITLTAADDGGFDLQLDFNPGGNTNALVREAALMLSALGITETDIRNAIDSGNAELA